MDDGISLKGVKWLAGRCEYVGPRKRFSAHKDHGRQLFAFECGKWFDVWVAEAHELRKVAATLAPLYVHGDGKVAVIDEHHVIRFVDPPEDPVNAVDVIAW